MVKAERSCRSPTNHESKSNFDHKEKNQMLKEKKKKKNALVESYVKFLFSEIHV